MNSLHLIPEKNLCKHTTSLPVGGFIKQSLIDYPGHLSAVVFTSGCNMRCSYCHNPDLVYPELIRQQPRIDLLEMMDWLSRNRQLLDAVVITGGEPTLHAHLPEFIRQIHQLGLKVKLDTNGTHPDLLAQLIGQKLVDYVAMDIKAPLFLESYRQVVGSGFTASALYQVIQSVLLLNRHDVPCEYRTTAHPGLKPDGLSTDCQNYYGDVLPSTSKKLRLHLLGTGSQQRRAAATERSEGDDTIIRKKTNR